MKQRRKALRLGVAPLKELLLGGLVDVRVFQHRFKVSLYAGHRCLQLVSDVLRKLPLQHVLLLLRALQALVYLYYALGNLAQLVTREADEVFGVKALIMVGAAGEEAQLHDVVAQAADETVKYEHEDEHCHEREPQVMLVGLEYFVKAVVVRQGRTQDEVKPGNIRRRIEIILVHRRTEPAEVEPAAVREGLAHLGTVAMVLQLAVVLVDIIIHHAAVAGDERHAQPVHMMVFHIPVERFLGMVADVLQRFNHPRVVILEPCVERVYLVFALTRVLKDDERRGEYHENGQHADVKACSYRSSEHIFQVIRSCGFKVLWFAVMWHCSSSRSLRLGGFALYPLLPLNRKTAKSHLCVEIIAETEARNDTLRELANLLAQTCYVDVYRAVEHEHVLRPNAVDKLLTREHTALLVK